jgi:prepilin-type N-terminal cleavage/methylation domain-containing protein
MPRQLGKKGITMLELAIALAILAAIVVVAVSSFSQFSHR